MALEEKTVIVTGAAMGIGLACAERFAADGANVVLADINEFEGNTQAKALRTAGHKALFVSCDVGDKGQVDGLIKATVEAYGGLDVLINNAGILHAAEFLDLEEEDFDRVLRVNLKGMFLVGQAAARQMAAQGHGGSIINMSSVNAVLAIPNITSYVVCKGAVNQLTKVMAVALADQNIRVNGIGPGTILTDLARQVMTDEAARKKILSRTPLGRCGEPDEVAAVAAFLAGDEASYITGETIYVDGGRMGLNYTVPVEQ